MILLRVIGFLWTFIVTLLSWIFFFLPHYLKGTFEDVYMRKDLAIIWDVDNNSDFYKKAMSGWYGFVIGANVCVVDVPRKVDVFRINPPSDGFSWNKYCLGSDYFRIGSGQRRKYLDCNYFLGYWSDHFAPGRVDLQSYNSVQHS